jgi:hypothetical protein
MLRHRLLWGLGLGALGMYVFDPDRGRRRRALFQDQLASQLRCVSNSFDKGVRDLRQRAQGFVCEMQSCLAGEAVDDRTLRERVRSKLGRYVGHPGAIEVQVHDGRVALSGPILANEVERLCDMIRGMHGVRSVDHQLDVHEDARNISALQGGRTPPGEHWNINEANWAPGTRLAAAAAGSALVLWGMTRRFPVACVLGTAGLALLSMAGQGNDAGQRRRIHRPDTGRSDGGGAARRDESILSIRHPGKHAVARPSDEERERANAPEMRLADQNAEVEASGSGMPAPIISKRSAEDEGFREQ